jgi:inosine/xanthosine triphosphatase
MFKQPDQIHIHNISAMTSIKPETKQASQKIVVASKNPVKIAAALAGFSSMFPNTTYNPHSLSVPSGVPSQPFTDAETLRGALNRAQNARTQEPQADYWVGIEGGVEDTPEGLQSFAWVVVINHVGKTGKARTAAFYQPAEVAVLLREGVELGDADDIVFGRSNSKQAGGSVGLLTGDVVDRKAYYLQAVILALIPFKNAELSF